jgi:hypothetical protein
MDAAGYGPPHPEVGIDLNNLAVLDQSQGEAAAARPPYERAVPMMECPLGPDHPTTRAFHQNLAGCRATPAKNAPTPSRPEEL